MDGSKTAMYNSSHFIYHTKQAYFDPVIKLLIPKPDIQQLFTAKTTYFIELTS